MEYDHLAIGKRFFEQFGRSQLTDWGQALVDEAREAYNARHEYPLIWEGWKDHDCLMWLGVQLASEGLL